MTAPARPKAYSYLRFSTPEQEKGDSFRRQTQLAEEYAQRHGLELDVGLTFQDRGVSAFRGKNARQGALRAFLDLAEEGIIQEGSYLLVESLDRISRDAILAAQGLFLQIIQAGIVLVTLTDQRVYSAEGINANPTDLIISLVGMMRAHEESATKARRLKAAWEGKRAKAHDKPLTAKCPGWLELDQEAQLFRVIEERASVVRWVFEMTLAGKGQHAIAEALNREGVPTFGRAAHWHRSYVKKLLSSLAVTGVMVPHQTEFLTGKKVRKPMEPIPGYYPPVVEEEVFQRVQAQGIGAKAPLARQAAGGHQVNSLLAGLARCPLCGGTMTRVSKGSKAKGGKPYLVCTTAKARAGCTYHAVHQERIEAALIENLAPLLASAPSGDDGLDHQMEKAQIGLDAIGDAITNILEALTAGPSPALNAKLRELEQGKEEAEAELRALAQRQLAMAGPFLGKRLADLEEALEANPMDRAQANARLRQVFNSVVVDWPNGVLAFDWKQGGMSEITYAWPQDHTPAKEPEEPTA